MNDAARISAIIPVYNGASFLAAAIDSALGQTYAPFEVVVIDDGSTDNSAAIANAYGGIVRCISQPNGGLSVARNAGIAATTGEFVALLDADDLWPADSLQLRLDYLLANPDIDTVVGNVIQFQDRTGEEEPSAPGALAGNTLVRRTVFDRIGRFDPQYRVGEFVDWHARARAGGIQFGTIPEVVLRRRLHDANMGIRANAAGERVDYVRVLRAALERKRAAGGSSS